MRSLLVMMLMGIGLLTTAGADSEDVWVSHAKNPKTIILGKDAIIPGKTTMSPDDVVEFKNMWGGVLTVTFIEPKDITAKIRCELISGKTSGEDPKTPPWDLFQMDTEGLYASIPPGRFASICRFAPGDYAFIVRQLAFAGDEKGTLPNKGTIHVE